MSGLPARKGRGFAGNRIASIQLDAKRRLEQHGGSLPPFGPRLGLSTGKDAVDVTVVTRFLKKFEKRDDTHAAKRAKATIADVVQHDSIGFKYLAKSNQHHFLTKARLGVWFNQFRPTYAFAYPTGESAESSGGRTQLYCKLAEQPWEVSPELLGYAATICYKHHALKRVVRERYRSLYPYISLNDHLRAKCGIDGFAIFKQMFKMVCSIRASSRFTTVPKSTDVDRAIDCVPIWDMVCQLSFMHDIRTYARERIGHDLTIMQDVHRSMIRNSDYCTIDLKNASNSVWWNMVQQVWPQRMVRWFRILRNEMTELPDGSYHYYNMLAPMGCGITFDVMTYTLLAALRCVHPSAQVYGDDIIIAKDSAEAAVSAVEALGMQVNRTKSFLSGAYRESCGGFFHEAVGDIVSYEAEWATDLPSTITLINKIGIILTADQISVELHDILLSLHNELVSCVPRDVCWGGHPHDGPDYVWTVTGVIETNNLHSLHLQRPVRVGVSYTKERIPIRPDERSQAWIACALLAGRRPSLSMEGKKWKPLRVFTCSGALITSVPATPAALV